VRHHRGERALVRGAEGGEGDFDRAMRRTLDGDLQNVPANFAKLRALYFPAA
jgi:hypothetical protein